MVNKSIVLRKVTIIRDSLKRLKKYSKLTKKEFLYSLDVQDIVLHNLLLTIQASIDLGGHVIADEGWGVPGSQSDIFYILKEKKVIKVPLLKELIPATGLRNILVHEYEEIDLSVIYSVMKSKPKYFEQFIKNVTTHFKLN